MSTEVTGTPPSGETEGTSQAGETSSTGGRPQGKVTGATPIKSLEDLKEVSPELYRQMMESIGMNICNESKKHQDEIKRLMREGQAQGEGRQ